MRMGNRRFELAEKGQQAMFQAMNGKEPKQIAKDLGMSKSGVFAVMQREGIMTKSQVISMIEAGKSNELIHEDGKWTIEAIESTRKELIEKQEKRKAARKASDRKRKEKMKAERQPRIEVKQAIKRKREQSFREALALGLSTETIAMQFGFKDISTVRVKKSKEGLLGRKEIIALLPEKSDEEIAGIAGIENVDIITQIRQEEEVNVQRQREERIAKQQAKIDMAQSREEEKNHKLRVALAEGKKLKEITSILGVKDIGTVSDRKQRIGALTRKEIIALLPEKSDEELVDITGIRDISIIRQIRQEEMPETVKKIEESTVKPNIHVRVPEEFKRRFQPTISKKDEAKFLKLAQSLTGIKKIATELNLSEEQVREALDDYNILTREEVIEWLPYKSDMQIAIMGDLVDYMVVERVRKEEDKRRLAQEEMQVEETVIVREIEDPEIQAKREETMFFRMARNYVAVEKMGSVFNMTEYAIILKLRKLGLRSRTEIERMIEQGGASDEEIAGETGNVNAVTRIRGKIQKRELLIESIPKDKQELVRRKVSTGIAASAITYDTRIPSAVVAAIQEKWKRDKDLAIPLERKKANLKIAWMHLETEIQNLIRNASQREKDKIQHRIDKILVVYEELLTQRHCAYIAYAYMKMEKYEEGIKFTEAYLGLRDCSKVGVKNKINEILEQEKKQESTQKEGKTTIAMMMLTDLEESVR